MEFASIYFILSSMFYTIHICKADLNLIPLLSTPSIINEISEATLSEDGKFNFTQLVNKYGHSVRQYDVTTEDGYILTIFNVPGDKKRPVLLLHGILQSSDTFVVRGNTSLGITLANEGYDVWVGNNRGNLYGRRHVTLDPDRDDEFWDYSFHEIGLYDLPAMIDFVCEKTGEKKISTVSNSQGTTAHFVLLSLRPEYNNIIKIIIALTPVAYTNNFGVVGRTLFTKLPLALKLAGINEVFQDYKAASNVIKLICSKGIVSYILCGEGLIFALAGNDTQELEPEFLNKVAVGHFPRGASRKCFEHYGQTTLNTFAQFDYGLLNKAKYGRSQPPEYNLTLVTTNVAMFFGGQDLLATLPDVERLRNALPNVVHYQEIETFAHLAFVSGRNMPKYLFPNVLRLLKKYD